MFECTLIGENMHINYEQMSHEPTVNISTKVQL